MKKLKIINFVCFVLFLGCASAQKVKNKDFYDIVNIMLHKAKEKRDSVYVIDWKSKKYYQKMGKFYNASNFSILNYKKMTNTQAFFKFKKYLKQYDINIDEEILYFKKQLKYPFELDKQKITLNELKVFPTDSDWYKLKYNNRFTNYYYTLSKPLITKDGKRAIYYQGGSDYANFFIVLIKQKDKWKIVDEFNANRVVID